MLNKAGFNSGCRPRDHLNAFSRRYPEIWKGLESYRSFHMAADDDGWPAHIYCPLRGAFERIGIINKVDHLDAAMIDEAIRVAALAAWRYTQGIYRFDPTLYAALVATRLEGELPCALLTRLPGWCVYIETPGLSFQSSTL